MSQISISTTLEGGFDEVISKTESALKEQGFGILTRIDVKSTLKEKIGEDFIDYVILGACNPKLAFQALSATLDVGLLMPCNVVVYQKPGEKVTVSAVNPGFMEQALPSADLGEMASTAKEKLSAAIESL
jgi:uncharacterized protein (DUF302 family)